jgi:NADPH2:quinone reductase
MRAAYHREQGGTEVLVVGEVPDAVAGPDEVLVQVRATSLDRVDVYFREGSHGMRVAGRHIGGRDVAGTIASVGHVAAGRRPDLEVGQDVVGVAVRSAHAELVAVPAAWVFPLPAGTTFEAAAAIPTAGRSAYDALVHRARIQPGEEVLVFAGGSGVGSFGIQVAAASGCRVLTTVGRDWKAAPARAIGADVVIDHHREDVAERVLALTGGRGVDVVLDHVGTPVFDAAMRSLARFGRYVTTGVTAGHRAELHLGWVFERGLSVLGVGRPGEEHVADVMRHLLALVAAGRVRPVIHAVLPIDQIAEGHRLLESSEFFGKVVLTL